MSRRRRNSPGAGSTAGAGQSPTATTRARRDWFGTVVGLFFILVAALVALPLLASITTPDQVGSAFKWVLAPGLVIVGAVGLVLATRRGDD